MIIAIPRRDHFVEPWKFSMSLINLLRYEDGKGRKHTLAIAERSNASKGKRDLAKLGDDMLFMDTDMVFDENALERLLTSQQQVNADIISGIAVMGSTPYEPAIFKPMPIGDRFERYVNHPSGIIETGGSGLYFTLVKKSVIIAVGIDAFLEENYCGERVEGDLMFHLKARQAGYKVFCDTNLKIGHLRSKII